MNGPTFAPAATLAPAARPAAPPRPPARVTPALKAADEPAQALRVLTYLRLHWMMILFCGTLLGAGLAYAAWSLMPSKFESTAIIFVATTPPSVTGSPDAMRGQADFPTYMKTQAGAIRSEFVLRSAMNDKAYKITDLPMLRDKDDRDILRFLEEKLVLSYSDGSQLLKISMEGDKPDDIRKTVDAVKDAYFKEMVQKEIEPRRALKDTVDKALVTLADRIRTRLGTAKPAGLPALPGAVAPGVPSPLPEIIPAGVAVPNVLALQPAPAPAAGPVGETDWQKRVRGTAAMTTVIGLEQQLAKYPLQASARKARIEALKQEFAALRGGPPSAEAVAQAAQDPDVWQAEVQARTLSAQVRDLRQIGNDPNDPALQEYARKADALKAQARELKEKKVKEIETARRQPEAKRIGLAVAELEQGLALLQEDEKAAQRQLEVARRDAADMPPDPKKEGEQEPIVNLDKSALLTSDRLYNKLYNEALTLDMEMQAITNRVRPLQSASTPMPKDPKKQVLVTIVAGLLGFGLVGLGVVAAETKAQRVSSLAELRPAVPTPVVGVIPWAPDPAAATDPLKRADVTEAIDKLRSYVAQTWLTRGATTVAVTSPVGDEGKAFTALGLATSLAAAGYKTLLVDFDLRAPTLHTLAGVDNDLGVCELLRGEADPKTTPRPLPTGLHFVPAGRWTEDTRSAAVGGRLEAVLRKLRDPYDCVILHGHALLTVAEAVEIARRAEVVLLCSQYRDTRLPLLKRAADRVAALEVPYSGVVYLGATAHEALC